MSASISSARHSRDTGFPEPLDGNRNTTLPHPDADLSPNACISQDDDLSVERAYKRSRRHFLGRRKRTVSHGFIGPHTEVIQSTMSLTLDLSTLDSNEAFSEQHEDHDKAVSPTTASSIRFSKDRDSMSTTHDRPEDTPPSSPEPSTPSRRKSLFSKLRRR